MFLPSTEDEVDFETYFSPNEIATILKTGKTVWSKVMYFLLIIINSIESKTDNGLNLTSYVNVFSKRGLESLKSDLENLQRFDSKFFNSLIQELIREVLQRENNYRKRSNYDSISFVEVCKQRWYKLIIKRKVKAIVRFLVFRKLKYSNFYANNEIENCTLYKKEIKLMFENQINQKNIFNTRRGVCYKSTGTQEPENNCKYIVNNSAHFDGGNKSMKIKELEFRMEDDTRYICIGHSCNRIYCPLCYGWLWIPLYYCCIFLYPIAINTTCNLASEIAFR